MTTTPTDDAEHGETSSDGGVDADRVAGTSATDGGTPRRRRVTPRIVVSAALVGLCVAAAFSLVALRVLDRGSGVDPAVALSDLTVGPAVPAGTPVARVGEPAPTVELRYLDGGRQPLTELQGTPLLLNFWASTCPPCITEMPVFERLAQRADGAVRVVGVDVVDTPEAAQRQIARTGVTYRNAADPTGSIFAVFGGTALPRTVLVGADGRVLDEVDGALDDAALADLLARNGVAVP